jgi:hypothetical protein
MSLFPDNNTNARATIVNRTHRIVREQALDMRAQQERKRSLWVPLAIFSVLLPLICYAAWGLLDGYGLTSDGVIDSSDQLLVMLVWLMPLTALAIGAVWFRRARSSHEASQ